MTPDAHLRGHLLVYNWSFVQNTVTMSAVIASVMPHNKTNVTGDGVSTSEIA